MAEAMAIALTDFDLDLHQPHLPACFWWLLSLGRLALPLSGGNGVAALLMASARAIRPDTPLFLPPPAGGEP